MEDLMDFAGRHIIPHWPFYCWLLIAMLIGQIAKRTLWTREHARDKKPHWFWWWMRKTMALHPVLAGCTLGVVWRSPEPGADTMIASMGYFAMAGALSTWTYEFLNGLAKKRGVDLALPGYSEPPDPDETPRSGPPPVA